MPQTQTFTDVQPIQAPPTAQTFTNIQPITQQDSDTSSDSLWGKVKSYFADAHIKAAQLNADAQKMNPQQFAQAHPDMTIPQSGAQDAIADVKAGNYAKAIHRTVTGLAAGAAPLALVGAAAAPAAAVGGTLAGAGGQYLAKKAATAMGATPDQSDVAGDVGGMVTGIAGGAAMDAIVGGAAETGAGRAVTQKLAPELENMPVSSKGGASSGRPATQITNREVLQHAADEGIQLTPAQALQTPVARSEQTFGEEALLSGSKIGEAVAAQKGKLNDAVDAFQDRLDPQRVGLSPESAGEHLQDSANVARSVLKDNVNDAYSQVAVDQQNLAGDVRAPIQQLIHDQTMVRQPGAAVEQPVFQTAAAKAAIKDLGDMMDDPAMQGRQSIQSLRNLRTTLLEKGNDYGANALSDSGQRIYKLAAGKVDQAIMDAAQGTPLEQTFREAGAQNTKLQQLYNTKGSPLYRILNTSDPAQVTNGILNRSSVQEIEALKGEGIDTGPLARQAVEDIQNNSFKVTPTGLGGYPDSFLRSLLGPDETRELYLKAEIARRLAENYNPSGSGKVVLGAAQLTNPIGAAAAQAARARSMPQSPIKYLSEINKGGQP